MNTRSKRALASVLGAATVAAGVAGTAFGQFSPSSSGNAGNGGDGGSGGTGSQIEITTTATCGWNSNDISTAVVNKSPTRCGKFSAGNNRNISTKGGPGGPGGKGGRTGNVFNRF